MGIGTPTLGGARPAGTRRGSLLGADRHTALPHLLPGLLDQTTVSRAALSPSSEGQSLSFRSSLTLSGDFDTYKMATRASPGRRTGGKPWGQTRVWLIPRTDSGQVLCELGPGVCTLEDRKEGPETLLRGWKTARAKAGSWDRPW